MQFENDLCYNRIKLKKKPSPHLQELRQTAERYASIAEDHKAISLKLLDVSATSGYADYILWMSATSDRHARSLADAIVEACPSVRVDQLEGYQTGQWILIDLGNIVVHVFQEDAREHYNIDRLWSPPSEETSAPSKKKTMFVSL